MSSSMLRATPGWRRIRPARSSVRTIWWTEGGVTRKWRCISASAGGRRNMRERRWRPDTGLAFRWSFDRRRGACRL